MDVKRIVAKALAPRRTMQVFGLAATIASAPMFPAFADSRAAGPDDALVRSSAFNATVFGYPLDGMYQRLTREVLNPSTRVAGFNAYFHFRRLATPELAPFPAPNTDTLYSTAWIDLRREPAILAMPDTHGRYYTAQVMDMTTETLANIGQRADGTQAGLFALVGPNWSGEPPPEVKRVVRCDTAFAYVLLRVLVDGPEDVAAVNALKDGFKIASLQRFRRGESGAGEQEPPPPYRAANAAERLAMLDRVLRMSPVREVDKGMAASFATIGDRTRDLVRDADGALTIAIQAERPEGRVNWLPAPKSGFYMVLRLYGPAEAAREGSWLPPAVAGAP